MILKKIKSVQLIGIILFVIYILLIVANFVFDYLGDYANLILSIVLAMISLNQIYKGVLLRSSTTLWFAMSLILSAICLVVFELLKLNPIKYYFIFPILPIFSSIINLVIFSNLIYIKIIIINLSIILPIFIMYFTNINYWYIIAIGVASFLLCIFICKCLKFSKEKV